MTATKIQITKVETKILEHIIKNGQAKIVGRDNRGKVYCKVKESDNPVYVTDVISLLLTSVKNGKEYSISELLKNKPITTRGERLSQEDWNRIIDILYSKKADAEENAFQEFQKGNKRSGERIEAYIKELEELIQKVK